MTERTMTENEKKWQELYKIALEHVSINNSDNKYVFASIRHHVTKDLHEKSPYLVERAVELVEKVFDYVIKNVDTCETHRDVFEQMTFGDFHDYVRMLHR